MGKNRCCPRWAGFPHVPIYPFIRCSFALFRAPFRCPDGEGFGKTTGWAEPIGAVRTQLQSLTPTPRLVPGVVGTRHLRGSAFHQLGDSQGAMRPSSHLTLLTLPYESIRQRNTLPQYGGVDMRNNHALLR